MKKRWSLFLAVMLAALSLTSCSWGTNDEIVENSGTETAVAVTSEGENNGEKNTGAASESGNADNSGGSTAVSEQSGSTSDSSSQQSQASGNSASQSSNGSSNVNNNGTARTPNGTTGNAGNSNAQNGNSSSNNSTNKNNTGNNSNNNSNSTSNSSKNSSSNQSNKNSSSNSTTKNNSGGNTSNNTNNKSNTSNGSNTSKNTNNSSNHSSGNTSNQNNNNSSTTQNNTTTTPSTNQSVGNDALYQQLFNLNTKVNIQITMSKTEMDKMQQDYVKYKNKGSKSPIYRMADVVITVGGTSYTVNEVGIRPKGNMSLEPVYGDNGKLNLSHYKLSFNETFDDKTYYGSDAKVWSSTDERKARKNRRFATLKKLDVKWNRCYDDTHIREIYAANMFKENGVLAQKIGLSQLTFNGQNYGVMTIYEPIDKIFLERYLPQSALGGDLYKCGWTNSPCNYVNGQVTYGVEDKDKGKKYNFNLKTNESSSNHSSLKNLLSVLASSPTKAQFESVVDTDYLANFLAVSYFAGDPDDMRNNYNNHYIYFRKDTGKAIFISYDNDRTLGITNGFNPDGAGMTSVSPYSNRAVGAGQQQANPLIKYAILNSNAYIKDKYTASLKRIASSSRMNVNTFNAEYNKSKNNYQSVVTPSISFANVKHTFKFSTDAGLNMSFSSFLTAIMKTYNEKVK